MILFCVLFGGFLAWGYWETLEIEGVKFTSFIHLQRQWAEDAKINPEKYLTTKQAVALFETPINFSHSLHEIKPSNENTRKFQGPLLCNYCDSEFDSKEHKILCLGDYEGSPTKITEDDIPTGSEDIITEPWTA